ncbi:MAG: hypothetical protein ACXVXI_10295 [Mycobacteriaceae bacterium]
MTKRVTKRLLLLFVVAVVGVVIAKKLQDRPEEGSVPAPAFPRLEPLVAETLPAQDTPEVPRAHTLRPSPVPRARPLWTASADSDGTGRHHAAQEQGSSDGNETAG